MYDIFPCSLDPAFTFSFPWTGTYRRNLRVSFPCCCRISLLFAARVRVYLGLHIVYCPSYNSPFCSVALVLDSLRRCNAYFPL